MGERNDAQAGSRAQAMRVEAGVPRRDIREGQHIDRLERRYFLGGASAFGRGHHLRQASRRGPLGDRRGEASTVTRTSIKMQNNLQSNVGVIRS